VKVPIPMGARLTIEQCPRTLEEIKDTAWIPYAIVAGNLMYAMVYTEHTFPMSWEC
jgi:hypothetical protein